MVFSLEFHFQPNPIHSDAAPKDRLYYPGAEWHFNERGNLVFAKYLHSELANAGIFPKEHSAIAAADLVAPPSGGGIPTWLKLYAGLWAVLGTAYVLSYRDEKAWKSYLKVGGLLAFVFTMIMGGKRVIGSLPPAWSTWVLVLFVLGVLGFVVWKLGRRVATILELLQSFTLRGHWYLMPLIVVLLSIGSLLVVAASSPLIAPFIYTLF